MKSPVDRNDLDNRQNRRPGPPAVALRETGRGGVIGRGLAAEERRALIEYLKTL
jgi:hypothetical protein